MNRPPDPEAFLAEAHWVRSLAQRLLRDAHAADDLEQDVWVAALEGGPRTAHPRGWLGAVARNLSSKRQRAAEARRRHEERAPERPAAGDPGSVVERMEMQRRLAEAVLALDEPYRTAVVLRHLDGLSAGAIARRQGCSRDTARQRVARGIARLRAKLDRDFDGGRAAWMVFVGELARGPGWIPVPPALGGGALALGGAAVGAKSAIGVACGAAVIAVMVVMGADPDPGQAALHGAAAAPPSERPAPQAWNDERSGTAPIDPADAESERRAVTAAAEPALPGGTYRGVVLDTAGRPLAGATGWLGTPTEGSLFPELAPAVTDGEGRFTLLAPHPVHEVPELVLGFELEGYVDREVPAPAGAEGGEVEITLLRLPSLEGNLIVPAGHEPPSHARIVLEVSGSASGREESFKVAPDEHGAYRFEALPVGTLRAAGVRARGYRNMDSEPKLELLPETTETLDLELDPGATVTGIVRDAVTGEPLADAEVWADGWKYGDDEYFPTDRTDATGRFALEGVKDEKHVHQSGFEYTVLWVYAQTPRHASTRSSLSGQSWNANRRYEIEISLEPSSGSLAGVLVDGAGDPAPGMQVRLIDSGGNMQWAFTDQHDASFRFSNLPPGELTVLGWRGRQYGSYGTAREVLDLAPGEHRTCRLELREGRGRVAGRMLRPDGSPAVGVRIELRLLLLTDTMGVNLDEVSLYTGQDGSFAFTKLAPGTYDLVPRPATRGDDSCRRPHDRRLEVEADTALEDIEFVVGACGSWSGTVEPGEPPAPALRVHLVDPRTGDTVESVRPEEDGSFQLEELAGYYDLVLMLEERELSRRRVGPGQTHGLVLQR